MIEAVMLWTEPNNLSHWDYELDPDWQIYAAMVKRAGEAVAAENPHLRRVLGGISPIETDFIRRLERLRALDPIDVVAVHGFPLDWNHWSINQWPDKLEWIRSACDHPIWVTEVGVSSFGAEEVQEFGVRRTAELLRGQVERIHWYSLYDVPRTWAVSSRNPEAEGSAYYRHFYMGLLKEDGTPKRAIDTFAGLTPDLGICQWFHFEDHRLDDAVRWLRRLGVKYLRTGLSWADSFRPNALDWFDRMMEALSDFQLTVTCCYTPPSLGLREDCASPPREIEPFADFCAAMVRRYAPGSGTSSPEASNDDRCAGVAP
jgi:beta-xylosidase